MEKYIAIRDNKTLLYKKKWEYGKGTVEEINDYVEQYIVEC